MWVSSYPCTRVPLIPFKLPGSARAPLYGLTVWTRAWSSGLCAGGSWDRPILRLPPRSLSMRLNCHGNVSRQVQTRPDSAGGRVFCGVRWAFTAGTYTNRYRQRHTHTPPFASYAGSHTGLAARLAPAINAHRTGQVAEPSDYCRAAVNVCVTAAQACPFSLLLAHSGGRCDKRGSATGHRQLVAR